MDQSHEPTMAIVLNIKWNESKKNTSQMRGKIPQRYRLYRAQTFATIGIRGVKTKKGSFVNMKISALHCERSGAADPSRFAKTAAPLRREASVCCVLPASLCLFPFPS